MAKLNLLFFVVFLFITTSALADDVVSLAEPPFYSEPLYVAAPPMEPPVAEGPIDFDYYAAHDKCLKMVGNLACAEEIAYVVEPDIKLGLVPASPSKSCCQNVMSIDSMAPECWDEMVQKKYMFLKDDLLEYCAEKLAL